MDDGGGGDEGTYLDGDDALHLYHPVPQSFDLLVLHVVLKLHFLETSEFIYLFIYLLKCFTTKKTFLSSDCSVSIVTGLIYKCVKHGE